MSAPIEIDIPALEAMVAAGASGAMILAALKVKQTTAEEKLKRDRLRDAQRKRKSRTASAMSGGHGVTSRDIPDAAQAVASPPTAPTPDVAGTENANLKRLIDRGSERARANSMISPEAYALADECRRAVKATEDDYHGLDYQAQSWIASGYAPTTVVRAFVETAARYGPNKPMSYLAKAIDTACTRAPPPRQRHLPLLSKIEGNADDLLHPAVRTDNFAVFAADLRAQAARRKTDSAA